MTHDELLVVINKYHSDIESGLRWEPDCFIKALRAVVELHKPYESPDAGLICQFCVRGASAFWHYPCPTIDVIQQEITKVNDL